MKIYLLFNLMIIIILEQISIVSEFGLLLSKYLFIVRIQSNVEYVL